MSAVTKLSSHNSMKALSLQAKGQQNTTNRYTTRAWRTLVAVFILAASLSPSLAMASCVASTPTRGCPVSVDAYNRLNTSQRYQWAVNQCFSETGVTYRQAYALIDGKGCSSGADLCRVGSIDGSIQLTVNCKTTN